MNSAVYWGSLMHNRIRPKKHRFRYRMASWLIDLDELATLHKRLRLFSFNAFNLIAFHSKDYGDGSGSCLKQQIIKLLSQNNIDAPDRVELLCSPRILGYVFNPLSVYLCYRKDKTVAVVYEVSNTFNERHSYVIPANASAQEIIHQSVPKRLHVSPFFPMDCYYRFRIEHPDETLSMGIELLDQEGKLFAAVLQGNRKALDNKLILQQLCLLPWQTLKVIAAIHWEALKLWIKGIKIVTHKPAGQPFSWSAGESVSRKGSNL